MTNGSPYIYLRGLRQVDHTVFCVSDGQKTYYDPVFRKLVPYSSGQQVKRSILDEMVSVLGEQRAPITFNFALAQQRGGAQALEQKEPWSPCDPAYADQLIGGWMRAGREGAPVKRRSPLSISAMRPLHPGLSGLGKESLTFDRSEHPEQHNIRVTNAEGVEVVREQVVEFLRQANRNEAMRIWIPADKVGPRATGLFVYDVAIDLRTLFSVSLNDYEPEITQDTRTSLQDAGWSQAAGGLRLVCPAGRRETIADALVWSLLNWRVTSNQSRTYSPQATLAAAIGGNANRLCASIRAELSESSDYKDAIPILDQVEDVALYIAPPASAYVAGAVGTPMALGDAANDLRRRILAHDYES